MQFKTISNFTFIWIQMIMLRDRSKCIYNIYFETPNTCRSESVFAEVKVYKRKKTWLFGHCCQGFIIHRPSSGGDSIRHWEKRNGYQSNCNLQSVPFIWIDMVKFRVFHYVIAHVCLTSASHLIWSYISTIKPTEVQQKIWDQVVDTAEETIKKLVIQQGLRSMRIASTWIIRQTTEPSPPVHHI